MPPAISDLERILAEAVEIDSASARQKFVERACAGNVELQRQVEELVRNHFQAGAFLEQPAHFDLPTNVYDESAVGERGGDGGRNEPIADGDVADGRGALADGIAAEPVLEFEQRELLPEAPGTMIGPYKLREVLGEGGMGIVYVAEQEQPFRRKVALKVIKPGMDTREVISRFEAERQALALMDHPNIAKVLDAGATDSGRPYFVMELVRGRHITEYCDKASLPPRDRLKLFIQVCQAVQHAHQKGVIHRDLKPSNVLVTLHDGTPVPKVIDFGVAKAINQRLSEHTVYTRMAQIVGTPVYMSPEQAELSALDVDTRSDVYSLGVMLYELLTGTTPFDKDRLSKVGFDEMRRIIREDDPPRPSQRISTLAAKDRTTLSTKRGLDNRQLSRLLSGDLDWIVMKALEKDRQRRYESASAFATDVQRYLADRPVEACPPSAAYRLRKYARRNKIRLTALSAVVAAAIAGTAFATRNAVQATALVNEALEDVARHEGEAQTKRDDLLVWSAAVGAARRAEALASASPISRELRQRVADRRADLERDEKEATVRLAEAAADQKATTQFNAARLEGTAEKSEQFDFERAAAGYARAFREYQIDLAQLSVPDAADRMRGRQIRHELVVAALDWALFIRDETDPFRKKLFAIAGAAATDAPTWEKPLIDALTQDDPAPFLKLSRDIEQSSDSAVAFVLIGRGLRDREMYEQAVAVLSSAQKRYPGDFWLNHFLGISLKDWSPDKVQTALPYFMIAVALRPDSPSAHNNLGLCFKHQGGLESAITEFHRALELNPGSASARSNLAAALTEKGDIESAIAECQRAIELAPDFADAHNNLGVALKKKGDLEGAVAAYRRAADLQPNAPIPHSNLGDVLRIMGDLKGAIAECRHALELQPDYADALDNLGQALAASGDRKAAAAAWNRALELQPENAKVQINVGGGLRAIGEVDGAIAAFRRAVQLRPAFATAHYCLGVALGDKGDRDAAFAEYRRALELKPDYAEAHCNLAFLLRKKGAFAESLGEMRRGHELGSRNSNWSYPSGKWVADAERLALLNGAVGDIPAGDVKTTAAAGNASAVEGATGYRFVDHVVAPNAYGLAAARALLVGPAGNIYVASHDTDFVKVFGGTGRFLRDLGTSGGELDGPWGMTFGPDGRLYVSGRYSENIVRFDISSCAYDVFVTRNSGGLGMVRGLAFGPDGNLYASSHDPSAATTTDTVKRYDGATGQYLGDFVTAGSGGLDNANGVAFGPDGNLYVASTHSGEIKRYNGQTGAFIDTFVPAESGGIGDPTQLLFRGDGFLYVTATNASTVYRFNATTGAFVDLFASSPDGIGGSGLAFASTGELYVSLGTPTSQTGSSAVRFAPTSWVALPVTLAVPSAAIITVDYSTADGSAVAGTNYVATSGTLVFAPGETTKDILVKTLSDGVAAGDQTFTVNLSNPSSALTLTNAQGTGTIRDGKAKLKDR